MQGFWNKLKADWYRRGLEYSGFPKAAMDVILPRAGKCRSFLDVGAGCGSLAIPLARAGKTVTALDASRAMINILNEDIRKEGLKGIKPVVSEWDKAELKAHDAVLCANVPTLLSEPEKNIKRMDSLARKAVFIIENADPHGDKFYYRELYPLLFGKPFGERADYFRTYSALHSLGIFANVEIIEYDFDQPFTDMEEAIEFWKEYIGIVTEEHDRKLRAFLEGRLVRKKGQLFAKFHKKSAVMWWTKGK
jgi:SAM-dependent methyltransferase